MKFQQPTGRIDIRITILGLVLGAHALLVFALAGGLPWFAGRDAESPIEIKLIRAAAPAAAAAAAAQPLPAPVPPQPRAASHPPRARTPAPLPQPAKTEAPPASQPAPPASQAVAALAPPARADGTSAAPQPAATQPPAPHQPVRVPAQALAKDCATPEYPRKSYRYNEQGTVTLALLVGIDGHVVDSRIAQSSGFKELDEAALAALSLCRFKPGTADGKPEPSWATLRYQWKIE